MLQHCQVAVFSVSGIYSPGELVAHKQKKEKYKTTFTVDFSH